MTHPNTRGVVPLAMLLSAIATWFLVNRPVATHAPPRVDAGRTRDASPSAPPHDAAVDVRDKASDATIVRDAHARPDHHYWCEFERVVRRNGQGFDATLSDGTHRVYLAIPKHGLVAAEDVPRLDDADSTGNRWAPFGTVRTSWGWDGGVGHMGQRVTLGGETWCYEWDGRALRETPCR